jgi:single-stranded DNA-binding protein
LRNADKRLNHPEDISRTASTPPSPGASARMPRCAPPRDGKPWASFPLAVDAKTDREARQPWVRVALFGDTVGTVAPRLTRGAEVYCEGRLSLGTWKPQGGLNLAAWKVQPMRRCRGSRARVEGMPNEGSVSSYRFYEWSPGAGAPAGITDTRRRGIHQAFPSFPPTGNSGRACVLSSGVAPRKLVRSPVRAAGT